jgi:hypothetical protein
VASYVIRGLGVIAAAGVFAFCAPSPAQAGPYVTLGDCTLVAHTPSPPELSAVVGRKFSRPRASARCSPPHLLFVELELYEGDLVFDARLAHDAPPKLGLGNPPFGPLYTPVKPFYNVLGWCNEDAVGADELYTKARFRVNTGTPISPAWSAWSPWARGLTATFNC